ncbi:hypothetical protein PTTG_29738 [Puccinia triticina 1-1 BBBD Race 1]|uniref:RING-type domain-containing protein n=1 Tax=Puccinia triticina (isolate 1-1 / race 1 (BBBD)) TaxID=630390 RepID=A0A180G2F9_PUCT1|nr:hypothetical protein PTTG_29738 [Puccinia triticina 1-1 BBBD Race 1]
MGHPIGFTDNSDFEHVVEISSHTETFDDYRDHAIVNFPRESASNGPEISLSRASLPTSGHTPTDPESPSGEAPQTTAAPEGECAVCFDELSGKKPEEIKTLSKCGHSFCTACINNWFKLKSTCPICRFIYDRKGKPVRAAGANSPRSIRANQQAVLRRPYTRNQMYIASCASACFWLGLLVGLLKAWALQKQIYDTAKLAQNLILPDATAALPLHFKTSSRINGFRKSSPPHVSCIPKAHHLDYRMLIGTGGGYLLPVDRNLLPPTPVLHL